VARPRGGRSELEAGVAAPRLFDQVNPLTGFDFGYYWIRSEALV
jgi:hypothetical protein